MANLGEITEIVNSTETTLEVGIDNYILLTNLQMHVGRPEDRTATVDGGALYTYGKADNFFTATLLLSTPELSSLNTLTQTDADGDMTSTLWKIVYRDLAGATRTCAATGFLREYDVRKNEEGKVEIDIFVRMTDDTLTIT